MSPRHAVLFFSAVVATGIAAACAPPEETDPYGEPAAGDGTTSITLPANGDPKSGDAGDGGGGERKSAGDASAPPGPCKVSFAKDVLPQIDLAGCAGVTCHGTRFGSSPRLETGDAPLTFKALAAHTIGGKPYVKVGATDPAVSAIHCHLAGQCGVKMPPRGGAIPKELVTAVDAWLACGAPQN